MLIVALAIQSSGCAAPARFSASAFIVLVLSVAVLVIVIDIRIIHRSSILRNAALICLLWEYDFTTVERTIPSTSTSCSAQ